MPPFLRVVWGGKTSLHIFLGRLRGGIRPWSGVPRAVARSSASLAWPWLWWPMSMRACAAKRTPRGSQRPSLFRSCFALVQRWLVGLGLDRPKALGDGFSGLSPNLVISTGCEVENDHWKSELSNQTLVMSKFLLKMAIEKVSVPRKNGDLLEFLVSLPEENKVFWVLYRDLDILDHQHLGGEKCHRSHWQIGLFIQYWCLSNPMIHL